MRRTGNEEAAKSRRLLKNFGSADSILTGGDGGLCPNRSDARVRRDPYDRGRAHGRHAQE
jgi:hypothetical protein